MGTFLTVGGVALQLLGAFVALRGLIKTHDAFAEKSVREIAGEGLVRWRARVATQLRRLLRRPRPVVIGVGAMETMLMTAKARAVVTWGALPKTTSAALAEIDRRLRTLSTRIDGLGVQVEDMDEAHQTAMKSLRADLEAATNDANRQVRHAAIEGLVGEAVGLMLVITGGVLQAWGALIPATLAT